MAAAGSGSTSMPNMPNQSRAKLEGTVTDSQPQQQSGKCGEVDGAGEIDIYRDTPVRYLGYANEVGESFRALIPRAVVWATYGVASAYVLADARHKGQEAAKLNWADESTQRQKVVHAVGDTIMWQGLASVAIPGFIINRLCKLSLLTLHSATKLPEPARKWTTTAIGLAVIPFLVKPIDKSVDFMMNNSIRRWYHIEPPEQKLVHHTR